MIKRQRAGDADGMAALYEIDAVLDSGTGAPAVGRVAIRDFFAQACARGERYAAGDQRRALVGGDLALTSTRLPDGTITAEVARRQPDGTWLWVLDRFSVA